MPALRLSRLPVYLIVGSIAASLAAATAGSLSKHGGGVDGSGPFAQRDLRFADRADGAVLIYDGQSPTPFKVMEGENGFLRGTLRQLARYRRSEQMDAAIPFHLAAWRDGRLTLDDPATGQRIELEAFGATNAGVFARLLPGLGGS